MSPHNPGQPTMMSPRVYLLLYFLADKCGTYIPLL